MTSRVELLTIWFRNPGIKAMCRRTGAVSTALTLISRILLSWAGRLFARCIFFLFSTDLAELYLCSDNSHFFLQVHTLPYKPLVMTLLMNENPSLVTTVYMTMCEPLEKIRGVSTFILGKLQERKKVLVWTETYTSLDKCTLW